MACGIINTTGDSGVWINPVAGSGTATLSITTTANTNSIFIVYLVFKSALGDVLNANDSPMKRIYGPNTNILWRYTAGDAIQVVEWSWVEMEIQ